MIVFLVWSVGKASIFWKVFQTFINNRIYASLFRKFTGTSYYLWQRLASDKVFASVAMHRTLVVYSDAEGLLQHIFRKLVNWDPFSRHSLPRISVRAVIPICEPNRKKYVLRYYVGFTENTCTFMEGLHFFNRDAVVEHVLFFLSTDEFVNLLA